MNVPKWVVACLVLMTVSMGAYTVSAAILQYTLIKPYVMGIAVVSSQLIVNSFALNYKPSANQYANCTVQIQNTYSSALAGTVYVYLYNAAQVTIASGQYSGTFSTGITTVTIPLTWVLNENATDIMGGRVSVQQT